MGKVDLGASTGAEGCTDVLQLLREQSEKIEVLARALSVIQQGMLRNNSGHVKSSVKEAKRDLQRGDRSIPGDLPGSLQLLCSGGEVLRRLEEAEVGPAEEGQQTSRGCLILQTYLSIGYNGEASRGNDSTKTTGSHGRRERSLGKPVRFSERQVHS